MLKQLCQTCGKYCYSADENSFSQCPYCGIRFSARLGPDKRCEVRHKKEMTIVLNCGGREFEARSTDFSKCGTGVMIFGEIIPAVGETVQLSATAPYMKAKVMWINKLSDRSLVGLRKVS
jgi:hypothetical protein